MLHHQQKSTRRSLRSKHFRDLYQEEQDLRRQKYEAPLVELEAPFIRGYERFFILTEEAKLRQDADKLTAILEYFQNYEKCRKGLFRTHSPSSHYFSKNQVADHYLKRPPLTDLVKKSLPRVLYPYIKARSIDFLAPVPRFRRLKHHQRHEKLTFRYHQLVKSYTQPHIVTHLPLHDPKLEARLQELDTILRESGHRGEVNKALHIRKWRECGISSTEESVLENHQDQLKEANTDPNLKSATHPRFFYVSCAGLAILHLS